MYEKAKSLVSKAKELVDAYEQGSEDIDRVTKLEKELPYDIIAVAQEILTILE